MRVVSLNGWNARAALGIHPLEEAELLTANGTPFVARLMTGEGVRAWARFSLWLTGALFVLLGAIVVVRRPDAPVTRLFGLFTGLTGVALGVSPATSGPLPAWSLVVQFVSLLGLAASLPAFATAFVGDWNEPRTALRSFWLAGGVLLTGYLTCLFIRPSFYTQVRVGFAIYFVTGILAALLVLTRKALDRRHPRSSRDARLALSGIACGTLPFVGLTFIPQSVHRNLVTPHLTALIWIVIPLTFAYAILRHEVLGIRRLVHRGMVYGATTAVLLAVMSLLFVVVDPLIDRFPGAVHPALINAGLLALGAFLFHFLCPVMRRFIDRVFYAEQVDSGTLLAAMRQDLLGREHVEEVGAAMVKRLLESLRLEAVLLFLGTTAETVRVIASAGSRADESVAFVRPRLLKVAFGEGGVSEMRWNSDQLLIARLEAGTETLGFLVLGPKEKGEIFLREERRLVETVTPILALAIRETSLLAELREVSERLTNAQEAERGRIARDLHDGPLQKAILLGGVADTTLRDRDGVARELAAELRELCARLRPAILDDLGLVPALEWLLEQTAKGFAVLPRLTLRGMSEDDRLASGTELALFRVTQEAVSNALKHGHPTSIHVALTRTTSGVELSVTDDGHGASAPGHLAGGLGIPGMRERLRQVGGSVSVGSNGGSGTMVSARIPHAVHREQ